MFFMNKETLKYFKSLFHDNEKIHLLSLSELTSFAQNFDMKNVHELFLQKGEIILDDWIKFYNSNNLTGINIEIKDSFKRLKDSVNVFYYCSDRLIIKSDINTFFNNLFLFIEFDDDSPIVIFENFGYLLFTPLGKVLFLPARQSVLTLS